MSVSRLTRCAVLTALALALSVAEGLAPLTILIPLPGGLLALGAMVLLLRLPALSLYGVSIAGAAAHNTGQILAAMAVLDSRAPLVYLAPLLLCSLVTGTVTGAVSLLLVRRVPAPFSAS